MLGLYLGLHGCLHNQAQADARSTGAIIKCMYCISSFSYSKIEQISELIWNSRHLLHFKIQIKRISKLIWNLRHHKNPTTFQIPTCTVRCYVWVTILYLIVWHILRWCRCERQKKICRFPEKQRNFFLSFTPAPSYISEKQKCYVFSLPFVSSTGVFRKAKLRYACSVGVIVVGTGVYFPSVPFSIPSSENREINSI